MMLVSLVWNWSSEADLLLVAREMFSSVVSRPKFFSSGWLMLTVRLFWKYSEVDAENSLRFQLLLKASPMVPP